MRDFLASDENDGILLIDADNAFNRVNRAAALWNVQYICPALKHVLSNFYRAPTRIFMNGESFFELSSQEGTTQGCPLAMAMYALALAPLTKRLQSDCKQVWYADDATGCDKREAGAGLTGCLKAGIWLLPQAQQVHPGGQTRSTCTSK